MYQFFLFLVLNLGLLPIVPAHPGHDHQQEAVEHAAFIKSNPNSVRSCTSQLAKRGYYTTAWERREQLANKVRAERNLFKTPVRRDFSAYNFSHESTAGMTLGGDERQLFPDNSTCVLQPEITRGPFYVDGEHIRSNITDGEDGVPLYLDIQLIDTSTCEPVPGMYMDLWHANASGIYSGIGNNTFNNNAGPENVNATFLRGVQLTNLHGAVQYETIFPGYYAGRAVHIHMLVHTINNTVVRTNGTVLGTEGNFTSHAAHVGQAFFDQDLIDTIFDLEPYNANTQTITKNVDDGYLADEAEVMDPFFEYTLLGDCVEDGILAWISIGIDPTADYEVISASTLHEDGGVRNENFTLTCEDLPSAARASACANGVLPPPPTV